MVWATVFVDGWGFMGPWALDLGPWTLGFTEMLIFLGFNNLFEECVNNGFDSLGLSCVEFGLS